MKPAWIICTALLLSSCTMEHWDSFFRVGGEIVSVDGGPIDWCWIELRQEGSDEAPWGNRPRRVRAAFNEPFIGQFESGDRLYLEIACDGYGGPQRTEPFSPGPAIDNYPQPHDLGTFVMKKGR